MHRLRSVRARVPRRSDLPRRQRARRVEAVHPTKRRNGAAVSGDHGEKRTAREGVRRKYSIRLASYDFNLTTLLQIDRPIRAIQERLPARVLRIAELDREQRAALWPHGLLN